MSGEDDAILQEFIEESKEHLESIEQDLLDMESDGENVDIDRVNKVFRAIHTIKGGAGFLGLETIKNLSHEQENVLNMIRGGQLIPNEGIMSLLLSTIDRLTQLVDDYANSNSENVSDFVIKLQAIAEGKEIPDSGEAPSASPEKTSSSTSNEETPPASSQSIPTHPVTVKTAEGAELFEVSVEDLEQIHSEGLRVFLLHIQAKQVEAKNKTLQDFFEEFNDVGSFFGSQVPEETNTFEEIEDKAFKKGFYVLFGSVMEEEIISAMDLWPSQAEDYTDKLFAPPPVEEIEEVKKESEAQGPSSPPPEKKVKQEAKKAAPAKATSEKPEATLRVNVTTLDVLMTLAGELVLMRNQLLQNVDAKDIKTIGDTAQRLDSITSELQMAIMQTRMQPIGKVFTRFQRVVRDLSHSLGKKINLKIEGKEVELDKTIIEGLSDPLTHLVRNSVDHGVETPEERCMNGKDETGTIILSAYHEGGQVVIEVADDGKGIDPNKIREKALSTGNFDRDQIEAMNDKQLTELIFHPGFSLAEKITDVSGRGVGMDVVATTFTKLGGVIDIDSRIGKGTAMRVKLPLTLAIIPSLMIDLEDQVYAIPQVNLVELVLIPPNKIRERIQRVGGALTLRSRGKLLPLWHLCDVLDIHRTFIDPKTGERRPERRLSSTDRRGLLLDAVDGKEEEEEDEGARSDSDRRVNLKSSIKIVVVSAGNFHYGLIVDEFLDSQEIVVKPLGRELQDCSVYAGATILGDGRVALIADAVGISDEMRAIGQAVEETPQASQEDIAAKATDKETFLLIKNHEEEQFAAPLSLIERIELVRSDQIEVVAGRKSLQYRKESLPLFSLEDVAAVKPRQEGEWVYILIFKINGKEMGLLASDVVDAVDSSTEPDASTFHQPGILASIILGEYTTLIVDFYALVEHQYPQFMPDNKKEISEESLVLVVDDARFYRQQLKKIIMEAGCKVITAEDGAQALEILKDGAKNFDMIFTDIEMPVMDGIELIENVKKDPKLSQIPMVAVTTVTDPAVEKAAREFGVQDYLVKLDKELLLKSLYKELNKT